MFPGKTVKFMDKCTYFHYSTQLNQRAQLLQTAFSTEKNHSVEKLKKTARSINNNQFKAAKMVKN